MLTEDRLRGLVDAGIALSSELSLQAVLGQLLAQGRALTGAVRAAVGTFVDGESGFEVTLGDVELLARPTDPNDRTRRAVLITLRNAPYATLVVADKRGGVEFSSDDEQLVALLAAQASVAIENARRYESVKRWLHQLEALTEVDRALARQLELSRVLRLVAVRLRELIGAQLVLIELPTGRDELEIRCADGEGATGLIGVRLPRDGSKSGRVFVRRRSERVDRLIEDIEAYQPVARRVNARAALYVPMLVQEEAIGLIVAVNKIDGDRFTDVDVRLTEAFADRAAMAVESSEQVARGTAGPERTAPVTRSGGLTSRESEVLRLVAMGLTDAEVAERLVVSPRTVQAHLRSIYRKLELTSRGAATRYAFEHDLI